MQVKTKVVFFIVTFFIVLIIGIFAGWKFAAIGTTILGLIGFSNSGKAIKQSEAAVKSADQSATVARKEASDGAASMDRLVQSGSDLEKTGSGLVAESEALIRESGLVESATNKQP